MVEIDITAKQLNAIFKASLGGALTKKEKQELGFLVLQARKKCRKF